MKFFESSRPAGEIMDFSWKLTYLAIWFINATGSLFLDMGLIQDNILMVFTKINNGKSLMHYIC